MSRRLVNYRLPEEVIAGINRAAKKANLSQTAWVEAAIRAELGLGEETPEEVRERRAREAAKRRRRQRQKNEWKRKRREAPQRVSAREQFIERRVRELAGAVPGEAARRALAAREWEQVSGE